MKFTAPSIVVLVAVCGLAVAAFAPPPAVDAAPASPEKVENLGHFTAEEVAQLDVGFRAIEQGAAEALAIVDALRQTERVLEMRTVAAENVSNAAAYRAAFVEAYVYDQIEPPPEEPPEDPPPPPPSSDPVEAGCRIPAEDLVAWDFRPVSGAGRPASVPEYGSGEPMEGFAFGPGPDSLSLYTGPNGWAESMPANPVVARDFTVNGYKTWGSNAKGVEKELVEHATVRGLLRTGKSIEHGDYRGGQGGGDTADAYSIARRHVLWENIPGAAIQHTTRDFWLHGGPGTSGTPAQECTDPATCFDDGPPVLIEDCVIRRASVEFDAASITSHAPQKWSEQGRMPRAYQGAVVRRTLIDNASTVETGDLTYNTPLFIAGKQWIDVSDCTILRDESVRPGGQVRPIMQLGDPYHPGTVDGLDYAPAVAEGGTVTVAGNRFWSAEGSSVHLWMRPGSSLEWSGNTLAEGSRSITLLLNGAPLGSVAGDFSITVE